MEVVEDGGGRLSVVLAGHPKLRNDLRRRHGRNWLPDRYFHPGRDRRRSQREYIHWLLKTSTGKRKA